MKSEPLKTATAIVGLLAGVAASVYVLGGLVVALRLLFDHFSLQGAVTAVGQLPRTTVITTALLNVIGVAACVGLFAAMVYGLADRPRARGTHRRLRREEWLARSAESKLYARVVRWLTWWPLKILPFLRPRGARVEPPPSEAEGNAQDRLTTGSKRRVALLFVWLLTLAVLGSLPALLQAIAAEDVSPLILPCVFAAAITYGVAAAGFYLIRRLARRTEWSRGEKALAAGAVWAAIAVVPALMLAGAKPFENARICLAGNQAPVEGRLIGETSDRVLLEEEFGEEAALVSLPADQVTRSEYGDVEVGVPCAATAEGDSSAAEAEAALEGHGSPPEVALATALRPYLLFDSGERWRPLEVGAFLAERAPRRAGQRFCRGEPKEPDCEPATGLVELRADPSAPDYVDIAGELESPASYRAPNLTCEPPAPALDCDEGPRTAIYYRRTTHDGRWYWDYWWFLRFNDYTGKFNECRFYCGDHEGDWEGVTVITTAATEPQLLGAIYAAHKDRVMVPADLLPRSGDHVLAFVAEGTHASYPFRCGGEKSCKQFGTVTSFRLPEERHDGAVPWSGNGDDCAELGCVRPLPEAEAGASGGSELPLAGEWAAWPGFWGDTCVEECKRRESSPRSPGLQGRFRCPWVPNRQARLAPDGTTSRSESAGGAERSLARCKAQRAGL